MDKALDNSAMVFFFALAFPGLCESGKQELDLVRSYYKVRGLMIFVPSTPSSQSLVFWSS